MRIFILLVTFCCLFSANAFAVTYTLHTAAVDDDPVLLLVSGYCVSSHWNGHAQELKMACSILKQDVLKDIETHTEIVNGNNSSTDLHTEEVELECNCRWKSWNTSRFYDSDDELIPDQGSGNHSTVVTCGSQ